MGQMASLGRGSCPVWKCLVTFEIFAHSGVVGKLATLSETLQGMHLIESTNCVDEIAVNQGFSTLKCALALL
jgi:hypothetical protein